MPLYIIQPLNMFPTKNPVCFYGLVVATENVISRGHGWLTADISGTNPGRQKPLQAR